VKEAGDLGCEKVYDNEQGKEDWQQADLLTESSSAILCNDVKA
jgi:hypothetical protein